MSKDQFELAKNFFLEGLRLLEGGSFFEAELQFRESLKIIPNRSSTLLNITIALFNQKKYSEANAFGLQAVEIENDMVEAWLYLGLTAKEIGDFNKGLDYLSNAIQVSPKLIEAYLLKIEILEKLNKYIEALEIYGEILRIEPQLVEVWCNQGNLLLTLERHDEALKSYDSAIQLDPKNHLAWVNRCICLKEVMGLQQSLSSFAEAKKLFPESFDIWLNESGVLCDLKKYDQALISCSKAIEINPASEKSWLNKANCLIGLQSYKDAVTACDEAIRLNSNFYHAWLNKGSALYEMRYFEKALASYDEALKYSPESYEILISKSRVLDQLKRYSDAISFYQKCIAYHPNSDWVAGELLSIKMKVCDWDGLDGYLKNIVEKISRNEKTITPFPLLALIDDQSVHKKATEIFNKERYPSSNILGVIPKRLKKTKLKIGYFSADFRNHPVSFLTAELFELHDKSQFEIIAFSFGFDDKSPLRTRLSKAFHQFVDVSAMSDLEVARFAREMDLDIAIDLGGLTADSRLGVFAYRVAPIQITYLGYLGTTGHDCMDYLLSDTIMISDKSRQFFSEKIAYLPSYQVNDRKRIISDREFRRQELGLPEQGFVFCSFNNNYKIMPTTFDGWMRILHAVEGSILFLYVDNKWAEENLKKEAVAKGIDGARLIFGNRMSADEYLARYRVCDLFLDTLPYNAGTTASDALWAGLPVLTLMGRSFASRVAASLLNAIGLPELITNTQEEYEALAIELAMNPSKLSDIKLKLTNNRLTTALFDTPLFAKNLELAYTKMYERYQADLQPEHISID
jgi:predicted O-linked N-acetylglucosamine transferase (SPINDLY family)